MASLINFTFCELVSFKSRTFSFQLQMCGSNLDAIYDKKLPKRLFPTDYLPDDYTGPNNGSVKDLISKGSWISNCNSLSNLLQAIIEKQVWMGCECESLNGLM